MNCAETLAVQFFRVRHSSTNTEEGGIMADNLKDRGPQDRSRINVNESWELQYWTKELGVSEEQLRTAVETAGTSAEAVRKHLGK
jgi:hypothetical protein